MHQPHSLEITVASNGKVDVHVGYRDHVPDLLSQYPPEVQRLAHRWFWWPTHYERDLWAATLTLAPWARATVHQHILHERAKWLTGLMRQRAAKQKAKEERRKAAAARPDLRKKLAAALKRALTQGQTKSLGERVPVVSVVQSVGRARPDAGTALGAATPGPLSLTEQLALQHGVEQAHPQAAARVRDWSRGR